MAKTDVKKTDLRDTVASLRIRDGKFSEVSKPKYYTESLNITELRNYMNDPHVWSCIQSRKAGTTMHEWDVQSEINDTMTTDYVRQVLNKLDMKTILDGILDAVLFGYSIAEIIYQKEYTNIGFEYMTVADVQNRPAEWFVFDNAGGVMFMKGSSKVPVTANKILLTQHYPSTNNPYGHSVLAKCKLALKQKYAALESMMIFTEKYGMPYLELISKGKLPEEEQKHVLAQAELLLRDGAFLHPDSLEARTLNFNDPSSADIFEKNINIANNEISKAILSQTLTTQNTGAGSYAMAKTHSEVLQSVIDNDRKLCEQSVNHLIELICQARFGRLDSYPKFYLYEESFVNKEGAETAQILMSNPYLKLTAKYFERIGLKADEFELLETPDSTKKVNDFNQNNTSSEFATGNDVIKIAEKNEKVTDLLTELLTENKFGAEKQFETMNDMLDTITNAVENAESYNDLLDSLPSQFKKMDSKKFNEFMQQILLISNIHGRNSIQNEVK